MQGETKESRWAGLVAIAIGGALGAVMRSGLAELFPVEPGTFPTTTFTENMIGCFLLGLVLTLLLERWTSNRYLRPFLCIGLLGAFTTFSGFAVETDRLLEAGELRLAVAYVIASVIGGVMFALVGVAGARRAAPTWNGGVVIWVGVALAGSIGAVARYGTDRAVTLRWGRPFPLGIFVVNVVGCLLLGILLGLVDDAALTGPWREVAGAGLLGVFTTFSTFGYETVRLIEQDDMSTAMLYVATSVAVGLIAAGAGLAVASII